MNRFFVDYKLHNKENDGWAYKTTLSTDNYDRALKEFHHQCDTYIDSSQPFDHVLIVLSDAMGNVVKKEIWDMPVSEVTE